MLNVWKNVGRYAQDGFTSVIHGKVWHEETHATASQALKYPAAAISSCSIAAKPAIVCDYIRDGGDRDRLPRPLRECGLARLRSRTATSHRIGCANQTTMLMTESLEIGEMFRDAMRDAIRRGGAGGAVPRVRHHLQRDPGAAGRGRGAARRASRLDLMLVVGGYNSSNTCNLARICAAKVPTFHIADPGCMVSATELQHRPVGAPSTTVGLEVTTRDWLPASGPVIVGLTAGASTPNNIVGEVIQRLERFVETSVTARRRRAEAHRSMVESSGRPGSDSVIRTACPRFRDRKR